MDTIRHQIASQQAAIKSQLLQVRALPPCATASTSTSATQLTAPHTRTCDRKRPHTAAPGRTKSQHRRVHAAAECRVWLADAVAFVPPFAQTNRRLSAETHSQEVQVRHPNLNGAPASHSNQNTKSAHQLIQSRLVV